MIKKIVIIQIILMVFLSSCKSVKEGLSGRKEDNSDEFLVKKKSPLILPPDFEKLPVPAIEDEALFDEVSVKDIVSSGSEKKIKVKSNNKSIEDFVLDQIKED
jgi:hypothetical protein